MMYPHHTKKKIPYNDTNTFMGVDCLFSSVVTMNRIIVHMMNISPKNIVFLTIISLSPLKMFTCRSVQVDDVPVRVLVLADRQGVVLHNLPPFTFFTGLCH